jgi:insertion element IS1 protein InsB
VATWVKKKEPDLQQVNQAVLQHLNPEHVEVEIWRADELEVRRGLSSELDEMWSYVRSKANPRWLWHAIDHHSGTVLAYVFGRRKDTVFLQLKGLLEPFGIRRFYTDGWGAYERHIDPEQHEVGKQYTQKMGVFVQRLEKVHSRNCIEFSRVSGQSKPYHFCVNSSMTWVSVRFR